LAKTTYDHLHQYRSVNTKKKLYRCTVEDCIHTISASLLEGRKAACPVCDSEIIVTTEHLRRAKITCIGCGAMPGKGKNQDNPLTSAESLINRAKLALASRVLRSEE
jgi:DNA-directed RNA polymerase subunit RPC12/RpoP